MIAVYKLKLIYLQFPNYTTYLHQTFPPVTEALLMRTTHLHNTLHFASDQLLSELSIYMSAVHSHPLDVDNDKLISELEKPQ